MPIVMRAAAAALSWLHASLRAHQADGGVAVDGVGSLSSERLAMNRALVELDPHTDDVISKEEQLIMEHFIDGVAAHAISAVFATIAILLSVHLIYMHLRYYARPLLQRQIVRIVLIVPVYALCSALALTYEHEAIYINTVRDVYEAFCIHCFLVLMLDFPGGEPEVVEGIKDKPMMPHPKPFCCLPRIRLGVDFIVAMKRTTLQFVVLKPLMALLSFVAMATGHFDNSAFQWFLLIVYNLSYTTALYGLLLFYMGTKHLLKGFSPVGKFGAVKIIVFATYYQSLIVVALPGMDELGSSEKWNDFIICIEMAMFAIMHEYAFSFKEFRPGGVGVKDLRAMGFEEPANLRNDESWRAVAMRFVDAFNMTDVLADLKRNFSSEKTQYIMQGVEGGILNDGTAQREETDVDEAAAQRKLERLARVRVVEEQDLGTDKEGLFASAPDSRAVIKFKEGDVKLTKLSAQPAVQLPPSEAGTGLAAIADPNDPYSFIVAVDGITDATKVTVTSEEERESTWRTAADNDGLFVSHVGAYSSTASINAPAAASGAGAAKGGDANKAGESRDSTAGGGSSSGAGDAAPAETAHAGAPRPQKVEDLLAASAAAAQALVAQARAAAASGGAPAASSAAAARRLKRQGTTSGADSATATAAAAAAASHRHAFSSASTASAGAAPVDNGLKFAGADDDDDEAFRNAEEVFTTSSSVTSPTSPAPARAAAAAPAAAAAAAPATPTRASASTAAATTTAATPAVVAAASTPLPLSPEQQAKDADEGAAAHGTAAAAAEAAPPSGPPSPTSSAGAPEPTEAELWGDAPGAAADLDSAATAALGTGDGEEEAVTAVTAASTFAPLSEDGEEEAVPAEAVAVAEEEVTFPPAAASSAAAAEFGSSGDFDAWGSEEATAAAATSAAAADDGFGFDSSSTGDFGFDDVPATGGAGASPPSPPSAAAAAAPTSASVSGSPSGAAASAGGSGDSGSKSSPGSGPLHSRMAAGLRAVASSTATAASKLEGKISAAAAAAPGALSLSGPAAPKVKDPFGFDDE